jgi:hypothetical protein
VLVEDWFGLESMGDVLSSWSEITPKDLIPHAITEPLIEYGLPLRYWGARSVQFDAVTGNAETHALIYTERSHGETTQINYQNSDAAQLIFNIGADTQGRCCLVEFRQT